MHQGSGSGWGGGGTITVTLFVGCSTQPTYLDSLQPSLHCFTKEISKGTEPWRKGASTWREGERERGRKGGRRNGGRKSSGEQYRTVMDGLTRVLSNLALTVLPSTQSVRIPAAEDPAPQRNDRCVAEIEKWHSVAHQLQSTAGISANKDT